MRTAILCLIVVIQTIVWSKNGINLTTADFWILVVCYAAIVMTCLLVRD